MKTSRRVRDEEEAKEDRKYESGSFRMRNEEHLKKKKKSRRSMKIRIVMK